LAKERCPGSPVPSRELKSITVAGVTRNCYARHAKYVLAALLAVAGAVLTVAAIAG
jgi:hypothetical protein